MRGDIELAGFVITQDEWRRMDPSQRAQLLRAATRRDEPWMPALPPPPPRRVPRAQTSDDVYDAYEVTLAPT